MNIFSIFIISYVLYKVCPNFFDDKGGYEHGKDYADPRFIFYNKEFFQAGAVFFGILIYTSLLVVSLSEIIFFYWKV